MGLRDELEPKTPSRLCPVALLLNAVPDEFRDELVELIDDHSVAMVQIQKLCKVRKWPVGDLSGMRRHRRKECKCL